MLSVSFSNSSIASDDRPDWIRHILWQDFGSLGVHRPEDGALAVDLDACISDRFSLMKFVTDGVAVEHASRSGASGSTLSVTIVADGEHRFERADQRIRLGAGDILVYDPRDTHRVTCTGTTFALHAPRELIAGRDFLKGPLLSTAARDSPLNWAVLGAFERISATAPQLPAGHVDLLIDRALELFLSSLNAHAPGGEDEARSPAQTLARIKRLIEERLGDEHLSATELARRAGLSVRYINKLFEAEGASLMRYVWARRLERIKLDLSKPAQTLTISEIAFRWGFSDAAHFARVFRKATGMSARDWRKLV